MRGVARRRGADSWPPARPVKRDPRHDAYGRTRRVTDLDAEIEYRRREILRLEQALADEALLLVSTTATPGERAQAILDTKQFAERLGRLKGEIPALERERARYQHELDAYRATVASSY